MAGKRYTLDERAATKLRRLLSAMETPAELRNPRQKRNLQIVCKITEDKGDGTYNATEVFSTGGAWADTDASREFGTADYPPIRHINDTNGFPVDSYVLCTPVGVDDADTGCEWVFGAPSGDQWHPYKARCKPASQTIIQVGYLRDPVYTPPDQMTVLDQDDTGQTSQYKTVPDTDMQESATLAGAGYIYYSLERDTAGTWTHDDVPQRVHNSAVWPIAPDVRSRIYVLIGTYEDAGTAEFSWHQVLRDDPMLWPRPVLPDFYPLYYTEATPAPHPAVRVGPGNIRFRSGANSQEFPITEQTMDLTATKYYYLEATITPGLTPVVASVDKKVEAAYPGYCTKPTTIYYLIGHTDGTRYWPHVVGTVFDGTVHSPLWTENTFVDAQGERVWAGERVAITGIGDANSWFAKIWDPGFHFRFGDLDQMDDGTPIEIGGTDDDIEQIFVTGVENDCTGHRLVIHRKKLKITVQSGIVIYNKVTDEDDEYIDYVYADAVTSLQVSGLNFQAKKTRLYGLCADAEGSWETWHTGTTCP